MKNSKDNKLENYIFESILNNSQFNSLILDIFDVFSKQNISKNDKQRIFEIIFGWGIMDEDGEIRTYISDQKKQYDNNSLLYKTIYTFIQYIFNIDDENHLDFILTDAKEEIETDIIYFFRDVLEYIKESLKGLLNKKEKYMNT